jgi:hypothetical protein
MSIDERVFGFFDAGLMITSAYFSRFVISVFGCSASIMAERQLNTLSGRVSASRGLSIS